MSSAQVQKLAKTSGLTPAQIEKLYKRFTELAREVGSGPRMFRRWSF